MIELTSGKTIRLTMAQALCRFLGQQLIEIDGLRKKFVQGVMGIFGHGNVTGIGQALEQGEGNLRYIRVQNEQAGVLTAVAYAKQTDRLGIFAVTSSIGPGASNMITGAATATVNRIPVLLLPGDIFACRQPDPVLQQTENPNDYTNVVNDCFKPVCRYWDRIERPEQLMIGALNAMRVLTDPADTGAVCLCLPQDVQGEPYDYPEEFFKQRVWRIDRRPVSQESLKIAIDKIKGKKTPLIVAGGGVHYSLATKALKDFAESTGIPVAETHAGKSALPWNHTLNLGGLGVMGTEAANVIAKDADLVIAVGTRWMDFTTTSKAAFLNPNVEILHINVARFDAFKMDGIAILADAREALVAITSELKSLRYRVDPAYSARISKVKTEWDKEVNRLYSMAPPQGSPKGFLAQTAVIGALNSFVDDQDVVVCAAGSMPGDLQRLWRPILPKSYNLEYGFSCMGYEVAGGVGVKFAIGQDRQVWVLVGDGSYLMMHTEIVTSMMEHQKLNIIVVDSKGFNSINNLATGMGSAGFGNDLKERDAKTERLVGPIVDIDFAANGRSFGAVAYSANSIEEFKAALQKARQETKTTVIHVKIVKGTNSGNYESWWRVGVSGVSKMPAVNEAAKKMEGQVKTARPY